MYPEQSTSTTSQKSDNNIAIDLSVQIKTDLGMKVEVNLDLQSALLIWIIKQLAGHLKAGAGDGTLSTVNERAASSGAVGVIVRLAAAAANGTRLGGNANRRSGNISCGFD
jgi:hypothetical protein